MHDLGVERLAQLAAQDLAEEQVAHDLDRAARRPRRAADEHQGEEEHRAEAAARATKSALANPVVVIIETAWKVAVPDCRLAVRDPVLPEHRRESARGDDQDREIEAELLVADRGSRRAAGRARGT